VEGESLLHRLRERTNTGAGRWVTAVLALAAMALAVVYFLRDTEADRRQAIRAMPKNMLFYCRACKGTGRARVPSGQKYPMACPLCGRKEAVPGFRCVGRIGTDPASGKPVSCGKIIEKKSDPVYTCPHCGKVYDNRVGGYPLSRSRPAGP